MTINRAVVYTWKAVGVRGVDKEIDRLDAKLARNKKRAAEAADAMRAYGKAAASAAPRVQQVTKASTKFGQATAGWRRGSSALEQMAGKAVAAAAAFVSLGAAVAGLQKGINLAVDFERGFNMLRTVGDGVTESTKEALAQLARDVPQTAGDILNAAYNAMSAGVKESELVPYLRSVSEVARAANSDMTTALGALIPAVSNFRSQGMTAARAADVLFATVKVGVTTIPELSSSLGMVLPAAAAAGQGLDTVGGAIAAMTKLAGGQTAENVTRLNALISNLSNPADETAEVLKVLGKEIGVTFDENRFKEVGLQQTLVDLERAADKAGISVGSIFKRKEAREALQMLTGENARGFAEALDATRNASGATADALSKVAGDTQDVIDAFKALAEGTLMQIGEKALPIIREKLTELGKVIATNGPAIADAFGKALTVLVKIGEWAGSEASKAIEAIETINRVGSKIADSFGVAADGLDGFLKVLSDVHDWTGKVTPGVEQLAAIMEIFVDVAPEGDALAVFDRGYASTQATIENLEKMPALLARADAALQGLGVNVRDLYATPADTPAAGPKKTKTGKEAAEAARRAKAAADKAASDAKKRAKAALALAADIEDRRLAFIEDEGARQLEALRLRHRREVVEAEKQKLDTAALVRVQAGELRQAIADEAAKTSAAQVALLRDAREAELAAAEDAAQTGPIDSRIAAIDEAAQLRIELLRAEAAEQRAIAEENGADITGLTEFTQRQITSITEEASRRRVQAYAAEVQAHSASVGAVVEAAGTAAEALGLGAAVRAGIRAIEEGNEAVSEGAAAASSFAIGDIPGAIAHGVAAGLHTKAAIEWAGQAAGVGNGGGGGRGGAGGGGASRPAGSGPQRFEPGQGAANARPPAAGPNITNNIVLGLPIAASRTNRVGLLDELTEANRQAGRPRSTRPPVIRRGAG